MQTANQPTADYHSNPPEGGRGGRVRLALGGGSGLIVSDDFYEVLRKRLVVFSLFLAGVISFLVVLAIILNPTVAELLGNTRWFALIVTDLIVAWLLWRRPPRSMFGLRVLEWIVLGPVVVLLLIMGVSEMPYRPLELAASESGDYQQAIIYRYSNAGRFMWFLTITVYSALIPNTLRRMAIMAGILAAAPLVLFAIFAYGVRPLELNIAGLVLFHLATTNVIAVVLVLFSTSRIDILRRQVADARKLGQYVLKEKLGAGGMGDVYRAEHALLRRPCAIKTIRPERAGDPDALRRFEREVQTTATLTYPNTVQVFDYGHADDGTFYYVMEYLPGLTLEQLVRQHGPLPPRRAIHFLRQVCAALGEAHVRGLTHRDIKPGNVMACERGGMYDVAKVLDFGLVRIPKENADAATMTREGAVAGTPAYMSPEQIGGQEIDFRSDIYSVGGLAYFLLTGQPPFAGRSSLKTMAAHLYETPAALPPDIPVDLAAIVWRCLAKLPTERWPDATSLDTALAQVAVPAWTPTDAQTWWQQAGLAEPGHPTAPTQTWATPHAASDA